MRKLILCILIISVAAACGNKQTPENTEQTSVTHIEWVDFVKVADAQYEALYTAAISDDQYIGDQIGEVVFKVDGNIEDEHYRIENGDAAYWKEGTALYAVKENPDLLAIKDKEAINGYRLYQNRQSEEKWLFEHVNQDSLEKVEVREEGEQKPVQVLTDEAEISELIDLLEDGQTREGDPGMIDEMDMYELIFDTGGPTVNYYPLFHDEGEWYWMPWDEEKLSDDIESVVLP